VTSDSRAAQSGFKHLRVSSSVCPMPDFDRIIRKFRKASRARLNFLRGALDALMHLRDWAEHQKVIALQIEQEAKELFEKTDDNVLYLVVGSALTSWAAMEEATVFILAKLLRTEADKAGLILYSTINFNVWISIIDELFAIDDVHSTLKPKWNKLAERMRRLKDDRDRIAHHPVSKNDLNASVFAQPALRPSDLDIRQKSLKYKPMANDDIMDFSSKVHTLSRDLLSLAQMMTDQSHTSPGISGEYDSDGHR
jgi:hypothetical protein